jgi:hypothetical protein
MVKRPSVPAVASVLQAVNGAGTAITSRANKLTNLLAPGGFEGPFMALLVTGAPWIVQTFVALKYFNSAATLSQSFIVQIGAKCKTPSTVVPPRR